MPEEMNVWRYSIIYNCSTNGIEALLSIAILLVLPLARLRKQRKKYSFILSTYSKKAAHLINEQLFGD